MTILIKLLIKYKPSAIHYDHRNWHHHYHHLLLLYLRVFSPCLMHLLSIIKNEWGMG